MVTLTFNAAVRIEDGDLAGFHRIVAAHAQGESVWLAFIGGTQSTTEMSTARLSSQPAVGALRPVARGTLHQLAADNRLKSIDLDPGGGLAKEEELDAKDRKLWEWRQAVMAPFLSHQALSDALAATSGIGPLVRTALEVSSCSRATVYRLWRSLCVRGFTTLSLMPSFDRCGAPGVLRPAIDGRQKAGAKTLHERLAEPEANPQRPISEDERVKILLHYRRLARPNDTILGLYDRIIEAAFVTKYADGPLGRLPVMPAKGTFPNKRQFRHVIESGTRRIERVMRRTTEGHFNRNLRGLRANNFHGVPGPGHTYAIDSTVGDIHLRSSVHPAWVIGRPVVYVIVDFWSTAIVGFYACLNGPSWDTAKLSLFSTFSDPALIAELWGYESVQALNPAPTAPFTLLCDRGEYLSVAARLTSSAITLNLAFNPAYRPDLKGLVEVIHRIAKDEQFRFVPGAINARRAELGLKGDSRESAMTMREYVHFLHGVFTHYNLFANREHRLTTEMMAVGVEPTPAGLWRFGHEAGIGYQKYIPPDQIKAALLQRTSMSVRRDGTYVESLRYEGHIASQERWTEESRNFGATTRTAYLFPGSASRIWTPHEDGMQELKLSPTARTRPETTLDEWRDSLMFSRLDRNDQEYRRLCSAATNLVIRSEAKRAAIARTKAAEAAYEGPKLNVQEARGIERLHGGTSDLRLPTSESPTLTAEQPAEEKDVTGYESVMNDVFAQFNIEETS